MLGITGRKKKQTGLERLNRDDLERERIRLEQTERRLNREIEQIEQKKAEVFRQGAGPVSDRQRAQLARQVRDLEQQIQGLDKQLGLIARNQQVLRSVQQLDETQRTLGTLSAGSAMSQVDTPALQEFVDRVNAEQELANDRCESWERSLSAGESETGLLDEDADTLAILEAMQQAAHGDPVRAKPEANFSRDEPEQPVH